MSLKSFFKKAKKAVKGAVGGFLGGGVPGAIAGAIGGSISNGNQTGIGTYNGVDLMSLRNYGLPALPTADTFSASRIVASVAGTVARNIPRVIGQVARRAPAVAAGAAIGTMLYDAAGNIIGRRKRRRRINPMNMRAARRAIRRIKGARKMLQQIERQLPKQRTTTRARPAQAFKPQFVRQG